MPKTHKPMEIIPSILVKTSEEFEKMVRKLEPHVERVHLDIGDGNFVSTKTISGHEELIKIDTKVNFDVHLMVSRPEDQMYLWYKTKANRFLIHAETDHGHNGLIEQIHFNGRQVGLVLNPETQLDKACEFADVVDFMQFMTVHPGAYGGEFIENVLGKISEFHGQYPNLPIFADGGINLKTIPRLAAVGVTNFVVGSYIVNSEDVGKAIEELREISNNK